MQLLPGENAGGLKNALLYFPVMQKNFDGWNVRKKAIEERGFQKFIHEREIWWCSLGVNIGDEQDGKNHLFERPVLVIKKFNRHIVLIVPLSTQLKENRYHLVFQHENEKFAIILSQLRLISTQRITRRIRRMDHQLFKKVQECIVSMLLS